MVFKGSSGSSGAPGTRGGKEGVTLQTHISWMTLKMYKIAEWAQLKQTP